MIVLRLWRVSIHIGVVVCWRLRRDRYRGLGWRLMLNESRGRRIQVPIAILKFLLIFFVRIFQSLLNCVHGSWFIQLNQRLNLDLVSFNIQLLDPVHRILGLFR